MSKHTPGQWWWNSYDSIFRGDVNKNESIDLIATISHLGDRSQGDEISGKRAEEAAANAQLIAAAPDLLEACKELFSRATASEETMSIFIKAKQAIVKAEEV